MRHCTVNKRREGTDEGATRDEEAKYGILVSWRGVLLGSSRTWAIRIEVGLCSFLIKKKKVKKKGREWHLPVGNGYSPEKR